MKLHVWVVAVGLFLVCGLSSGFGQTAETVLLQGTWGSAPHQLGLRLQAPGELPAAPYMGPGGFRLTPDGALWVSDSVNRCLKRLAKGSPPLLLPVEAERLGDLEVQGHAVSVVTRDPHGIMVFDSESRRRTAWIPFSAKSPGRLLGCGEDRLILEDPADGPWLIENGKVRPHPAKAIEPAGTEARLFGTLYDFDDTSRKIIVAGWKEEESEPELFSLYKSGGRRIVFSRLLNTMGSSPLLTVVTASDPQKLELIGFDEKGNPTRAGFLPILSGPYLATPWVRTPDGLYIGFSGTPEGFRIVKIAPEPAP
ncbi:MAG TPA: hypothetical protein PKO06_15605 [Candidatus Ozemobacteraceae bacterium]|nr:hypothetical protein [Candidatus Ozemobacteraceae bacterium]